jgi:D-alanyl-D-alanine carboxypeptidase/D-alanyl-D-alanine-endopeptidase (penicillin-binding protein 4)
VSQNYLNRLALKGFDLQTQGLLIESLDGRTVYADLNSRVGFNPASVIKVATSFAALAKFGPDYHFETAFMTDGVINKKTRTLTGDLILKTTGDPVLTSLDVSRLVREVVNAGVARVSGNVVVTGPFTYGLSYTDSASRQGADFIPETRRYQIQQHFEPVARRGVTSSRHTFRLV